MRASDETTTLMVMAATVMNPIQTWFKRKTITDSTPLKYYTRNIVIPALVNQNVLCLMVKSITVYYIQHPVAFLFYSILFYFFVWFRWCFFLTIQFIRFFMQWKFYQHIIQSRIEQSNFVSFFFNFYFFSGTISDLLRWKVWHTWRV